MKLFRKGKLADQEKLKEQLMIKVEKLLKTWILV